MIEKLTIRNFKSWEICDLEFGKVTALFGANSSGKTSILQFLLALKQTASSRDRRIFNFGGDERDYVDLGSYESAVFGHDLGRGIGFGIIWKSNFQKAKNIPNDGFVWLDQSFKSGHLSVNYKYSSNEIIVEQSHLIAFTESYIDLDPSDQTKELVLVEESHDEFIKLQDGVYQAEYTSNGKTDKTKAQFQSFYQPDFDGLGDDDPFKYLESRVVSHAFENLLGSIHYLGPLRAYPLREYRWTGERPSTVGVRGEFAVQTMLADMLAGSANGKQLQGQLLTSTNTWLKRLGVVEEIELRPIGEKSRLYEVIVKSPNFKHEANLADVGFGVSQVLPIVVMAHLVPEGSLVILEQPELHLHPNVQSLLADFFLELSVERNIQFLIESHSERLMARLQLLTVEKPGKLSALKETDLRFYHCRRDAEHSVLEPVLSDLDGNLTNVPSEFYDPLLPFIEQIEAEEAKAGNSAGEKIDLSTNHDYYIANPSIHVLRDKDDQSQ